MVVEDMPRFGTKPPPLAVGHGSFAVFRPLTALRRIALIRVAGIGLASCASDTDATDYSAENREAFLAACTTPGEDQRMIRDVCECTYERIEANMAFADFVQMEESLQVDALAPLPDPVAEFMAECFVEEVDL